MTILLHKRKTPQVVKHLFTIYILFFIEGKLVTRLLPHFDGAQVCSKSNLVVSETMVNIVTHVYTYDCYWNTRGRKKKKDIN